MAAAAEKTAGHKTAFCTGAIQTETEDWKFDHYPVSRRLKFMPVIARFYGILIKMYFIQSEHGVPHFHAIYGEYNAVFAIDTVEMIEGDLPVRC